MSTQLILYPQSYNGEFNSTSNPVSNQYLVNGINFTGLNGTTLWNTVSVNPDPAWDAIENSPPTSAGTWFRYTTTGSPWGNVTAPAVTSNNLVLSQGGATTGRTGIYQQLSGLIVGAVYNVTINISTQSPVGALRVEMYSGTGNLVSRYSANTTITGVSQIIKDFTAQTPNDTILIDFATYGVSGDLTISSMSVTESATTASLVYSELQDGQVICDLYQEEDIPLTLSIDDFKNVAEQVKSYSKDFNLPATKRNNQIFNNMFEVTRADDGLIFNPYVKTQCVLKQDGFILFQGYLRLIDIKDKEGEISYNVNLYSEAIALADILKDKTFLDLDISELNSDYQYTNIKASWDGNLVLENALTDPNEFAGAVGATTTDVLKYPFIDWNHQFFLDANGNPEMPNLNSSFRPCIQIKYLINKIFSSAGFNWTSNFFNTTIAGGGAFDFDKLYMDFNWGNDENPTDIKNSGAGSIQNYKTFADNFAPNGTWGAALLATENFPTEQGYAIGTGIFTIPVGQDDTTFTINYNFKFLFLNKDNPATLDLRWLVTPASGASAYSIDPLPAPVTVPGSAVAYTTISSGSVSNIDVEHGGYYTSVPTVTFLDVAFSSSGSGATATATGSFPGTVTGVTITNGGSGYNSSSCPFVSFDGATVNSVTYQYSGSFVETFQAGDTLQLQMKSDVTNAVLQDHRVNPNTFFHLYPSTTAFLYVQSTVNTMVASALLNALRGELGQWDFLKGIFTMFNLVTMVDESNPDNILIEPYSDVFINNTNCLTTTSGLTLACRSIQHDWTDKVDVSEMELKPLTDLNKNTVFKFSEDDDDYCFNAYKLATSGGLYGAKYYDASGFTILEGEKEIIAEPFAATVMKPLQDLFPEFIVPSIYSVDDSGASEGFDNSPRMLYDNGVQDLTSCTYTIPPQNGTAGVTNEDEFLQFSHLSSIPINSQTTQDFNFESQQLISPLDMNGMPSDNLYSIYWQPYFNELYNPDTRTMILKVNLSPSDVASFKFYDTVFIKNRTFRVNKIEYKPNDLATVEFILIP
jgi:hypothetical protein|tara:strand:+ start:381 stop:3482 length:3102 start_codon:yes stop_codon:yes gene_type:complete